MTAHPSARVLLVDDDAALRASLERFLRSAGYLVETFASGAALLGAVPVAGPACALVDLCMPEMGGLELQETLRRQGQRIPLIFMTAFGQVSSGVQAMKNGAVDYVEKPCDEQRLLDAIDRALALAARIEEEGAVAQRSREQLARLTVRERQVCTHLMGGLLNKQIAALIGISESTVKVHRGRMMKKLGVESVVELVHLVDRAGGL
jgi:FixJ family two-component response regulator